MSFVTLALVLVSALAHAAWNAILKRSPDPENAVGGMAVVCAASSVATALALGAPLPPAKALALNVASGLLEAGYFVTLARALARAPLGSVYTVVRGGALVLVWPASVALLGEPVTFSAAGGTVLVIAGLASTGAGERDGSTEASRAAEDGLRSGLAVAAVCAVFVAGYHLAYKLALANGSHPAASAAISLSVAAVVNVAALGRRRALALAAFRAHPIPAVVAGLLGNGGFLVFLYAMKDAGAGVVLTLRNTSILFAHLIALAYGDRPRRLGVIGALLVTAGAVLLAR
jgi:drug/metabolite transporter (DMT)-like permease